MNIIAVLSVQGGLRKISFSPKRGKEFFFSVAFRLDELRCEFGQNAEITVGLTFMEPGDSLVITENAVEWLLQEQYFPVLSRNPHQFPLSIESVERSRSLFDDWKSTEEGRKAISERFGLKFDQGD